MTQKSARVYLLAFACSWAVHLSLLGAVLLESWPLSLLTVALAVAGVVMLTRNPDAETPPAPTRWVRVTHYTGLAALIVGQILHQRVVLYVGAALIGIILLVALHHVLTSRDRLTYRLRVAGWWPQPQVQFNEDHPDYTKKG